MPTKLLVAIAGCCGEQLVPSQESAPVTQVLFCRCGRSFVERRPDGSVHTDGPTGTQLVELEMEASES